MFPECNSQQSNDAIGDVQVDRNGGMQRSLDKGLKETGEGFNILEHHFYIEALVRFKAV